MENTVLAELAAEYLPEADFLFLDTGYHFPETLEVANQVDARYRQHLIRAQPLRGDLQERPDGTRNPLQTIPLVETIEAQGYDAVLGGARRDEEPARAKERIFSVRDSFGGWDPRRQRPELWNLYNGGHLPAKTSEYSPSPTGPKPTSGNTSVPATSNYHPSTSHTKEKSSNATACGSHPANGEDLAKAKTSSPARCATAP